jgi:hypothetical protein
MGRELEDDWYRDNDVKVRAQMFRILRKPKDGPKCRHGCKSRGPFGWIQHSESVHTFSTLFQPDCAVNCTVCVRKAARE